MLAKELVKRKKAGNGFNFFHFMIDLNGGPCVAKRLSGCGSGCEYLACLLYTSLASVITPNIPEAEVLCGRKIENAQDMEAAAKAIYDKIGTDTAVLVKGGHERNTANDCLYTKEGTFWFEGKRVENDNTHGTGCTLSSAIACNLAMGHTMQESVENAKRYITGALQAGLNLGKGSGPLEHTYWLEIQGEK